MKEAEWVERMASELKSLHWLNQDGLSIQTGLKVAYGCEIRSYGPQPDPQSIRFETDLAVIETAKAGRWKPRVVVEAKLGSITTHDAITYSQKAASHRAVHLYLRYGIMLGNRRHYPLPGRLYRHGAQFDFMISFRGDEPAEAETAMFDELLRGEVEASRTLEKIWLMSRVWWRPLDFSLVSGSFHRFRHMSRRSYTRVAERAVTTTLCCIGS